MKVLTDNTADKLLRLLAGRGTPPPRSVPRPAASAPDFLNWRITVNPSTGAVNVGKGVVYIDGIRYVVAAAQAGTATASCLVVWESPGGISLQSSSYTPSSSVDYYRVLGEIVENQDDGTFSVRQHHSDPLEVGSGGALPGDNPAGEAVEIVLDGYGATADQRTWEYGDTDTDTGLPLKPTVKSPRLYWDDPNHRLLCFMRAMSYNSDGVLVAVSAESIDPSPSVFTTVSEMP